MFKVLRNGTHFTYLVFKVLRNGLLRYTLHTCPNLWCNSCSKCYWMDCFGTYFTHAQTCDLTGVQSAMDSFGTYFTHVKPVMSLVFKVLYGMDCFGTYCTHVQTFDVTRVQSAIRNGLLRYILHTCPNLWCNSCSKCYGMDCIATYCTHAWRDVTCVPSLLRNGLLRYILYTCPNLWCNSCSKCYGLRRYILHTCQTCDVTRVQSATEWTASVHTAHMHDVM